MWRAQTSLVCDGFDTERGKINGDDEKLVILHTLPPTFGAIRPINYWGSSRHDLESEI